MIRLLACYIYACMGREGRGISVGRDNLLTNELTSLITSRVVTGLEGIFGEGLIGSTRVLATVHT